MTWRRDEVDIGQRWTHKDISTIYEVVAISDRPIVFLRPVSALTGTVGGLTDLHYVIESEDFNSWRKVRLEGPER